MPDSPYVIKVKSVKQIAERYSGGKRGKLSVLYASKNEFLAILMTSSQSKENAGLRYMNVSVTVLGGTLIDMNNVSICDMYQFATGFWPTIFTIAALLLGVCCNICLKPGTSHIIRETPPVWQFRNPALVEREVLGLLRWRNMGSTVRPSAQEEPSMGYGEQNSTVKEIHDTVRTLSEGFERSQPDTTLPDTIEVNNKTYKIQYSLGKGNFGSAYEAIDSLTETTVAIKEILFPNFNHETITRRQSTKNEVKFLKLLNSSPNAIQLIDYEIKPGGVRIVTECGWKSNLFNLLEAIGDDRLLFGTTGLRYIWREILLAVKTVHDGGIIHGDIKMDNFVFAGNQLLKLKLIDFGCAHDTNPSMLCIISKLVIAPEHLQEGENKLKFRPSTDVWALGKLLYEILYRIYAYQGIDDFIRLLDSRPNADSVSIPGCPEHQIAIVKQCLDEEWSRRPIIANLLAKVNNLTTEIDAGQGL